MITRAKISAVRASGVRRLIEGGAYSSKDGNFQRSKSIGLLKMKTLEKQSLKL